jgi:hypothetical protein
MPENPEIVKGFQKVPETGADEAVWCYGNPI